jgi:hypothetical protein
MTQGERRPLVDEDDRLAGMCDPSDHGSSPPYGRGTRTYQKTRRLGGSSN